AVERRAPRGGGCSSARRRPRLPRGRAPGSPYHSTLHGPFIQAPLARGEDVPSGLDDQRGGPAAARWVRPVRAWIAGRLLGARGEGAPDSSTGRAGGVAARRWPLRTRGGQTASLGWTWL